MGTELGNFSCVCVIVCVCAELECVFFFFVCVWGGGVLQFFSLNCLCFFSFSSVKEERGRGGPCMYHIFEFV